jgi:hypothetical protein
MSLLPALAAEDYVRVSPRDPRYLELSSGAPYIPIGLNMIAPPRAAIPEESMRIFETWLQKLSSNGGNYIRVWLSNPFWDVEHEKCGVYDPEKAKYIDRMLDLCRKYNVRVKMTMEHFRTVGEPRPQGWADKPLHHVANGGTAKNIADFFDGEESRAQFRKKIRWYAGRYGDQPIIYGWELWNEVNAVRGGDYLEWTRIMLPELREAFPKNLVMQSLGSFDRARSRDPYRIHSTMPGNDLAQVHRYLDLGAELEVCKGPVDVLAADAIRELLSYQPGRPVILAESGAVEPRHSGPFKLYAADKDGTLLHDVLFAPFFAGAAGTGQIWHWDAYVAPNDLWHHFGRFAEAVKGIDPPAEKFEPLLIEDQRFRAYALKGVRNTLFWIRFKQDTWKQELELRQGPSSVEGVQVSLKPAFSGSGGARFYDPWTNKWTNTTIRNGRVRLPKITRSIVLRVELR